MSARGSLRGGSMGVFYGRRMVLSRVLWNPPRVLSASKECSSKSKCKNKFGYSVRNSLTLPDRFFFYWDSEEEPVAV